MHSWNVSIAEAVDIQKKLASRIITRGCPEKIERVAGVDLAFSKKDSLGFCSIIIFSYPGLEALEEVDCAGEVTFPYVPGLLTFREGPLFLKTFSRVTYLPDLIFFDGQGVAHPRRVGIASHMGLWLDIPSIGCAKSRLFGTYREPATGKGAFSYLLDNEGNAIGAVVRTREGVKPVFVSPGHLVGVDESVRLALECTGPWRVPVPTRAADIAVAKFKRKYTSTVENAEI
ncbi:MAG TPA: endonuclease V [Spirochaetes bacterium]|nr:endonuclease V [Spirochaetota bacterium]